MGVWKKLTEVFNPDDADIIDTYEGDPDVDIDDTYEPYGEPTYTQPKVQQQSQHSGYGVSSSEMELKVVKPETYDSATARKIANHLINNHTVVLNLELANKEHSRRLIDFLSGVAYSLQGHIEKVAVNTYVIVPKNVNVAGEQVQEVKKQDESDIF